MAKDVDDLLPKKKTSAKSSESSKSTASPQMVKVVRATRIVGILLGGFVTLVGLMSLVGLVTDNFWARFVIALLVGVGGPAFAAERVLRRIKGGGLTMVADVFAIVLLLIALLLVYADFASKPLFVAEGDRYARSGSRTMARLAYFLGGVSPVFPDDAAAPPAGSASASASASAPAASGSR